MPAGFALGPGESPKAGQDFGSDRCREALCLLGMLHRPRREDGGPVTPACSESKASFSCCCHCPCPAWASMPRAARAGGIDLRTPSPPLEISWEIWAGGKGHPAAPGSSGGFRKGRRVGWWGAPCPPSPPGEQSPPRAAGMEQPGDPQHLLSRIPSFSAARSSPPLPRLGGDSAPGARGKR